MKIAIASGKGGTGKTTVAVNLALVMQESVCLLDCDVEEPNGHLFLHPCITQKQEISVLVPELVEDLCNGCGACSRFCAFNAIAMVNDRPLIFDELCHGCGGCVKLCKQAALQEMNRVIGVIERGTADGFDFRQGCLNVGQPSATPLIRAMRQETTSAEMVLLDAPPGTTCSFVATVRDCDYVVLVTEPTPFGLHDLILSVEALRKLGLSFGVVVNRMTSSVELIRAYCGREKIDLLYEIPDERRAAEAYSQGRPLVDTVPDMRRHFETLAAALRTVSATQGVAPYG